MAAVRPARKLKPVVYCDPDDSDSDIVQYQGEDSHSDASTEEPWDPADPDCLGLRWAVVPEASPMLHGVDLSDTSDAGEIEMEKTSEDEWSTDSSDGEDTDPLEIWANCTASDTEVEWDTMGVYSVAKEVARQA